MNASKSTVAADLRLVQVDSEYVMAAFGFVGELDPPWADRLLTKDRVRWLLRRWKSPDRKFTYETGDRFYWTSARIPSVDLSELTPLAALEVLCGLVHDHERDVRVIIKQVRQVVRITTQRQVLSLTHLTPADFSGTISAIQSSPRWSGWVELIDIATTDIEQEWLRDTIRVQVVKPTEPTGVKIYLAGVTQGWLRDLVVDLMRIRAPQVRATTLQSYARSFTRLSRFLATRADGGADPQLLTDKVMLQFTEHLAADSEISSRMHQIVLKDVSAVLNEARALDLAVRHRLRTSFTVRSHHYPDIATQDRVERAFPLATFCFLMGVDQHLSGGVLNLARDIPRDKFDGQVAVQAFTFMGNYGRRVSEACELTADRLRFDETGSAAILYDNFKSGRDSVWLPIDARQVQPLREWIAQLRRRYPNTAVEDLKLFPATYQNPRGTKSIASTRLSTRFNDWVRLLEQAIILAKLRQATGVDLVDLCQLRMVDLDEDQLTVGQNTVTLQPAEHEMLADYRQDAIRRHRGDKYFPGELKLPLFPDPTTGQRARNGYPPVTPATFDPLGAGWMESAASYASPGIPGTRLGQERISAENMSIGRMRHTYLQHAYNVTRDIFLVKELADHVRVEVTINSYVTGHEQLRESVELLGNYRQDIYAAARRGTVSLSSRPATEVRTNNCESPQVLELGTEGCLRDRQCFDCEHYSADPSNIGDIDREITTCIRALATVKADPNDNLRPAKVALLQARITGWKKMRKNLQALLDSLPTDERERVELACQVVREFRDQVRTGGPNFGASLQMLPSTTTS
jgi:hypothetical protein